MNKNYSSKLLALTALVLATILTPSVSWGQSTDKCRERQRVIIYDYSTNGISWEGCSLNPATQLRLGDRISAKVQGINPIRHTVNVKINQTTFDDLYKVPSLISDQLIPKADSSPKKAELEKTAAAASDKIKANVSGSVDRIDSAKANLAVKLSLFSNAGDDLVRTDEFAVELRTLALVTENLENLKKTTSTLATAFCHQINPPCNASPEELIRSRQALTSRMEKAFEEAKDAAASLQAQKAPLDNLAQLYEDAEKRHQALVDTRPLRDRQFDATVEMLAPDFGTVPAHPPVAATGDELTIVVDTPLSPDALKLEQGDQDTAPKKAAVSPDPVLVIPVVGRRGPSFSTGIFFTNLTSPTFFKDSSGNAQMNETDRFTAAVGAMVHTPIAISPNPDFSFHLSLGVALKDNNPVYVFGPSLIIGRHQRTVFTAGIAGGQVNRLSGIKLGDMVTGDQPPTTKVFRTNFFLAISYNFGATAGTGQ